jgi:DNA-binding NtrC family response regulator
MMRRPNVLIADDDPSIRQSIEVIVQSTGMRALTASTGEEALEVCNRNAIDVVLLDVRLPDINGLQVLRQLRERQSDVGVIMVSVVKDIPVAVEAIKLGALDYLTKDFSPTELSTRLTKSLEQLRTARELAWLREEVARGNRPMITGRSLTMASVVEVANKVAKKPVTVLITGESGTGKEVLARHLHEHSDRCAGPFVAVNLPAIPGELVESTLFGHEKGSFTGATRQVFGKFELASGGTLFLDEVGNLKLDVQAKLLRALQEREIERVGSSRPIPLDIRVICANNRSLPKLVQEGVFREDLYWRLNVVPIELPPLRARREDIADLARYFLTRFAGIHGRPLQVLTEQATEVLNRYSWPGNIRELENLMERLVVVCDAQEIDANDLPLDFSVAADLTREADCASNFTAAVASFEKAYLRKVLRQNSWHRRRAAEQLGIGYSTLKSKLKAYGLAPIEGHDDEDS